MARSNEDAITTLRWHGGLITSLTTKTAISGRWANIFQSDRGELVPPDLIGAKIIAIGMPVGGKSVEGGGLAIEYRPADSKKSKRITLAFNDCGMWEEKKART